MTDNQRSAFKRHSKDFNYCEQIIKKHSKSFYTAFSQLPKEKALSVFAVYAFCRLADDAIDLEKNETILNKLKMDLRDLEHGKVMNTPMWRALSVVFSTFDLQYQPFYDMLTGQRMDLHFTQPQTEADLATYSYYVAGSVGLMLLPILSQEAEKIIQPAKKLGEAMQRTNILRDIGEDFLMGRIYLPKETMIRFNVNTHTLAHKNINKNFVALWEDEATYAEKLYDEAMVMMPLIDSDCREALLAATLIYRELLTVVRKNNYQVFTAKQKVSNQRKRQLLLSVKSQMKKHKWEKSFGTF